MPDASPFVLASKQPEPGGRGLVGGLAFAEAPDLWRRLGADGYTAGADEAVALGERLVGLEPAGG